MKLKSILSFQEIYDLSPVYNVLIYKDYKIPCMCEFYDKNLLINCKAYLRKDMLEKLTKKIYINDIEFYIADRISTFSEIGKVVYVEFTLISKEPFNIETITPHFGGVRV